MKLPNTKELLAKITEAHRLSVEDHVSDLWDCTTNIARDISKDAREESAVHAVLWAQVMRLVIHNMRVANPQGLLVVLAALNEPEAMSSLAEKVSKAAAKKGIDL